LTFQDSILLEKFPDIQVNPFLEIIPSGGLPPPRVQPFSNSFQMNTPSKQLIVKSYAPQTALEFLPIGVKIGEQFPKVFHFINLSHV
jgi:hypothetical protein